MDTIEQGTTWHRQITITDDLGEPVDPDELVAVLCPEWPITVTGPDDPGVYLATLTDTETAALPARLTTHWEMIGRVGGDVVPLVHEDIYVEPRCARIEP